MRGGALLAGALLALAGPGGCGAAPDPPPGHRQVVAEIQGRLALLGRPPPEFELRLRAEFGRRLVAAEEAINEEVRRVRNLPGGLEFFDSLKDLTKSK
jgi:hypothetical protein